MLNYVTAGSRLQYSNSGGAIASGGIVILNTGGSKGGVNAGFAIDSIPATTGVGVIQLADVFSVTKVAGTAWALGQNLYWNGTAVTTASTGNTWVGNAASVQLSADTTGNLLLNGLPYAG